MGVTIGAGLAITQINKVDCLKKMVDPYMGGFYCLAFCSSQPN